MKVDIVFARIGDIEVITPKSIYGTDETIKARCIAAIRHPETIAYTLMVGDTPIAVLGGYFVYPGVWELWALMGELVHNYARDVVKACRALLEAVWAKLDIRRMQAYAPNDSKALKRWFEALGLMPEGRLKNYGSEGQDFILYARAR